jgi:hypothetical protein
MEERIPLSNLCQFSIDFTCAKPKHGNGCNPNFWLLTSCKPNHSLGCPTYASVDVVAILASIPSLIWQMTSVELEPYLAGQTLGMFDVMSNIQI